MRLSDKTLVIIAKKIGLDMNILPDVGAEILSFLSGEKKARGYAENGELKIKYRRKVFNQDELSEHLRNKGYFNMPVVDGFCPVGCC